MMSVIYEPSGKAREYSPLACNLYEGCNHGCLYCYAPGIRQMLRENYLEPKARSGIVKSFEKEAKIMYGSEVPILFCFMSDPYNKLEEKEKITRQCIEIANQNKLKLKILTKSSLVLRDIDILKKHVVGMTLTFCDEKKSKEWEPGAVIPNERIKTLMELKSQGVKTWASFEPVIEPEESLLMMRESLDVVDFFKIGKLNNFRGLDKKIDWNDFLDKALKIIRPSGKNIYVKVDLREAASKIKLRPEEIIME
jgi:DNA repair photolyase